MSREPMAFDDQARRRRKARINAIWLALLALVFYVAFIVTQSYRGQ